MTSTPPGSFLPILLKMVENGDVIFDDGNLLFGNTQLFASKVLPRYFNHANLSSFERQLYYYSWRKIAKGSKSGPQVFYNQALRGRDPDMILAVRRMTRVPAKSARTSTSSGGKSNKAQNHTALSRRPLSKYDGVDPADIMSVLSKKAPRARANFGGSFGTRGTPSSSDIGDIGAADLSTGDIDGSCRKRGRGIADTAGVFSGDGNARRGPRRAVEHRTGISNASSAGAGHGGGNRGVRTDQRSNTKSQPLRVKGGALAVPSGTLEGGGIGSEDRTVWNRNGRTFCGWQTPRWIAYEERRAGGDVGGSSPGGRAAGGEGSDEGSTPRRAPAKRELDGGAGLGSGDAGGDGSSIHSLFTAVQIEINQRRRGSSKPDHPDRGEGSASEPLRERWANSDTNLGYQKRLLRAGRPTEFDHSSLPTPTRLGPALPAAEAFPVPQASKPTAPLAPASLQQDDCASLRLLLTSRDALRLRSPSRQKQLDGMENLADTPTHSRPSFRPPPFRDDDRGDSGFDGKDFGDSLLGSGGNGERFQPTPTSPGHGWATASDGVSSFLATSCCDNRLGSCRVGGEEENCGGGIADGDRGRLLSPARALPLTPSPFSLNRPEECLLGLW